MKLKKILCSLLGVMLINMFTRLMCKTASMPSSIILSALIYVVLFVVFYIVLNGIGSFIFSLILSDTDAVVDSWKIAGLLSIIFQVINIIDYFIFGDTSIAYIVVMFLYGLVFFIGYFKRAI